MTNERSSLITIGGEQYEMILTTRATKAISNRYGGLDNLGDKLMKSENIVLVKQNCNTFPQNQAIRFCQGVRPLLNE